MPARRLHEHRILNSKTKKQFRLQWQQGSWLVSDRINSAASGVRVDGAVVSATRRGADFVEGYIVSVHGLSIEDAHGLDLSQLASLGVGGHLRGNAPTRQQTQYGKVHLMADGQIQGGRCDRGHL